MFLITLFILLTTARYLPESPIVGILSLPVEGECETLSISGGSCFHSMYVKWIEQAGAQVVPVLFDSSGDDLEDLLSSINGILFTGGELDLEPESLYMKTAAFIYNWAVEQNEQGNYFTLWGTCQGMQVMSIIASDDFRILSKGVYKSFGLNLPLEPYSNTFESKIVKGVPSSTIRDVFTLNITVNLHVNGVNPSNFKNSRLLSSTYRIVSINHDSNGLPFISTMESIQYPFYAVQWHPERPQFDFTDDRIVHSSVASKAMQQFSNFFIEETRKSNQTFGNAFEMNRRLIYNFSPQNKGFSRQEYYFPSQLK